MIEHIQHAKDLLDEGRLWCKGKYHDRLTGKRCLVAALMRTHQDLGIDRELGPFMHNLVHELHPDFDNLATFNDFISTRWSDIEELLDTAIERAQT